MSFILQKTIGVFTFEKLKFMKLFELYLKAGIKVHEQVYCPSLTKKTLNFERHFINCSTEKSHNHLSFLHGLLTSQQMQTLQNTKHK